MKRLSLTVTLIITLLGVVRQVGAARQIPGPIQTQGVTKATSSQVSMGTIANTYSPSVTDESVATLIKAPTFAQSGMTSQIVHLAPNKVRITAADGVTATVESTAGVDLQTEYLPDYVSYLYQSGMDNTHVMTVTLSHGMAFAADGDYFTVNNMQVGKTGTGAMIVANAPGTYVFQGKSFNLAVGQIVDEGDKTGYVLRNRLGGRNLPIYWFLSEERIELTQ